MEKEISIKEKIINSLDGKFEVTKIEKQYWDSGVSMVCEFMSKGKKGIFDYTLEGGERGVNEIRGEDGKEYKKERDEDIYNEIFEWVDNHIEWWVEVEWDGKKVE